MAWTDPRTWIAGETVTAALMNTHVRDNFNAIGDAWTAYTPVWTASTTNPTIGNGNLNGSFIHAGSLVIFRIQVIFGSTTNVGSGNHFFSLPVIVAVPSRFSIGMVGLLDNSTSTRRAWATWTIGNTVSVMNPTTGAFVDHATPWTWATNDEINIQGMYEAT